MDQELDEGHPVNEEMGFNSKEGIEISVDVSLSYPIEPQKVPEFYVKYRVSDLDVFTHGMLRDIVRNSLNEVASTFAVEDIYGEHKAEFLRRVEALIQEKVAPVGVSVQQFGFIGAPRVPEVIAAAITAKAQAIQQAERARNELATTQAEAAKKIAEADGDAKSLVTRAQGEADANRIRQSSLTPAASGSAAHRKQPSDDRKMGWTTAAGRSGAGQWIAAAVAQAGLTAA